MHFSTIATMFSGVLFAVSMAQDAIVTITSPLAGTVYKPGDKAIISWIDPQVQTISQIVLARGPSTKLQPLNDIATNVDANEGKYVWEVPSDCTNADDYAFELGTSPNLAFAGPFSIDGCNGVSTLSGESSSPGGKATSGGSNSSPSTGSTTITSDNVHATGGSATTTKRISWQAIFIKQVITTGLTMVTLAIFS